MNDIQLLPTSWEVKINDQTVRLTPNEFRLLELLVKTRGQVVTRTLITDWLWPEKGDTSNSIEVLVYNVRRKLKRAGWTGIQTIPLNGYRIL